MMNVFYIISRLILMYGMYCVCSACGAYLEYKNVPPFNNRKKN